MWKNLLILIGGAVLFILSSCTEKSEYAPPIFPKEKELYSIRLSADGLMLSYPYGMCVDDNYIYVLSLVDNTWVQVYDKTDESFIGGYILRGQGPGEVIMGTSISYDKESNNISVFDEVTKKLLSYKASGSEEELMSFIRETNFNNQSEVIRNIWKISDDIYLVDGQLGDNTQEQKRFQLIENNYIVDEYNQFLTNSLEERMIYLLNTSITISPDRTKMAAGTIYGGVLEMFDLSGDAIKKAAVRRFYPPIVHYEPGIVRNTPETIFGFSNLYATDDYIYSVLIGDKNPDLFDKIAVFDWKGNEIVKYHADCLVFKLCQTENEPDKLYAIAFSKEEGFYLVYFQLN